MARWWALLIVWLIAACAQPTPSPSALSHFDAEGLTFDYPATWNAATYFVPSSFKNRLVYLSTETMVDPCDRNTSQLPVSCTRQPLSNLSPGGVLVDWSANGFPGWMFDSNAGTPISVGVLRGTIEVTPADTGCLAIGGETTVTVIVPTAPNNWMQVTACVEGVYQGTVKAQLEAMLASVVWH